MKGKRLLKYFIIAFVLLVVGGFLGAHYVAPWAIIQPQKINEAFGPEDLALKSEVFVVKTDDDVLLKGHWIKTKEDSSKGIMILVHGIGGCKEHFLGLAGQLAEIGVESIVFDLRAHGKSGGEFCTYGYHEKNDIRRIVDYVKGIVPDKKIGIWGNSLGGAIAIQSLEIDSRIEFGIIESTFCDLSEVVYEYQKRFAMGIGLKIVSDHALKQAGEIAHFEPDSVKPINSVKQITQPVFIAHGDSDDNISFQNGKELYNHLKSKDKIWYPVKNGEHTGLFVSGGEDYKIAIEEFIQRMFKNE